MHQTLTSSYTWDAGIKQSGKNGVNPFLGIPDPGFPAFFWNNVAAVKGIKSGFGERPRCPLLCDLAQVGARPGLSSIIKQKG